MKSQIANQFGKRVADINELFHSLSFHTKHLLRQELT